jgi:uncharacterized protein involved in exopolysaccharide biosynthesis
MSDNRLPAPRRDDAEVRLELTNAEGRQVWALYSRPPQEASAAETPLSIFLRELPPMAWKWRRYVGITAAGALALGVIYLMLATTIYGVSALILVENRETALQSYGVVRDGNAFLATQAEIIHSPPIVRDALVSSGIGFPEPEPGLLDRVKAWLPLPADEPPDLERLNVGISLASLQASPVLGTEVIALNYRTDDPDSGVVFLESVIQSYEAYVRGLDQGSHRDALALIEAEEAKRRTELEALEREYEDLRAGTGTLGEDSGAGELSVHKARLEGHAQMLVEAQTDRIRLENELRATRSSVDAGEVEALRAAEQRLAELRRNYSERHPEVRAAREQIEALRSPLPQASAGQAADLERRLMAARDTERRLTALYEQEFRKSKEVDLERLRERRLAEQVASAQEAHASALKLLQEKRLTVEAMAQEGAGVVVRVLEAPEVLDDALWPRPVPVLFCCLVIGGLAGLGLAVVMERAQEPEPEVYAAEAREGVHEGVRAG